MTEFQYFLYDNRTFGQGSYDWSLKVASGPLKTDRPSRKKFVEYCEASFNTRSVSLGDFGAAIGGIRLTGGRYLLCVTLESKDRSHRDSCAFVGILCPNSASLTNLLKSGDPIRMARSVYETESPPPSIKLHGGSLGLTARFAPRRLQTFKPDSSPSEVVSILLEHSKTPKPLPSILGLAAWTSDGLHALDVYDYAFFQNLPAQVVDRFIRSTRDEKGTSDGGLGLRWWLAVLIPLAAILVSVSVMSVWQRTDPADPTLRTSPQDEKPRPQLPVDARAYLDRIGTLLDDVKRFSSKELLDSPEYHALSNVDVIHEYEKRRSEMIQLLAKDLENFCKAVERVRIRHFFLAPQVERLEPSERAAEIQKRLAGTEPPAAGCRLLRSSFGFWTNRKDSVTGKWCDHVEFVATVSSKNSGFK